MDEMEQKLGAILGNPDLMKQIMSMAQSLGQQPAQQLPQEPPPPAVSEPGMDPAALQKIASLAGKTGIELSILGNKIYEKFKEFKISDYGYSQFNKYVKSLEHVKVEQDGTILKAVYKKQEDTHKPRLSHRRAGEEKQ